MRARNAEGGRAGRHSPATEYQTAPTSSRTAPATVRMKPAITLRVKTGSMKIVGSRSIASLVAVVLNVAWWGMAVAMVVAIWLAALPLWFDVANAENVRMDIPVWFTLEADPVPASAPELGIGNAEIRDTRAEGSLVFAPPSRVFVSLVALGLVGTFTIVWWIVTELRAVFRTLRAGRAVDRHS